MHMQPLRWLYEQAHDQTPYIHAGDALCWFCGLPTPDAAPSVPVRIGIRDTFTNHDIAQHKASPWLCPVCAWYFDNSQPLMWAPYLITPTTQTKIDRLEIRETIDRLRADTIGEPCVFTVPTSFKKHLIPLAHINVPHATRFHVQFEQQALIVDPVVWQQLIEWFDMLRWMGHNKTEIETGALHTNTLQQHGRFAEAIRLNHLLEPYRPSGVFHLLVHGSPAGNITKGEFLSNGRTSGNNSETSTGRSESVTDRVGINSHGPQESIPPRDLEPVSEQRNSGRTARHNDQQIHQSTLFDIS